MLASPSPSPAPRDSPEGKKVSVVRDTYVICFEAAIAQEFGDRELAFKFRQSMDKIQSPYAFIRQQGLREAVEQLSDMAAEISASNESGGDMSAASPAAAKTVLPAPYDAIQATVFSVSSSPSLIGGEGAAGVKRGNGVAAAHVLSPAPPTKRPPTNTSWERVQRALHECDYTTVVFRRIILPSMTLRTGAYGGAPLKVDMTHDEALHWTTLYDLPLRQSSQSRAASVEPSAAAAPESTERNILEEMLTSVSYAEQEMGLRLLQGLCMVVHAQRRNLAEGTLLPYAVECFLSCLQHAEALHRERCEVRANADASLDSASEKRHKRQNSTAGGGAGDAGGNSTVAAAQPSSAEFVSPVPMHTGLEAVIVGLIDAVEGACHYCPAGLNRLVQLGGVRAMLSLAYFPFTPVDVRCTVLDVLSVLMQEVALFRRVVVQGDGDDQRVSVRDELARTMIYQSMSGDYGVRGEAPPYVMDLASASKFDSAVREWFSQHGLSRSVVALMELRDVRCNPIPAQTPKAELAKLVQRANQMREKKLVAILDTLDKSYTAEHSEATTQA